MRVFNLAKLAHMVKPGQPPRNFIVPSLTWDRASSLQNRITADYQRGGALLDQTCNSLIDFTFAGGLQQHKLQPEQTRCLLRLVS
jgi:hypothetical protein